MWVLSAAGTIVGFWAIFRIAGLGIRWLREGFHSLEPSEVRKRKEKKFEEDLFGE